MIKDLLKYAFIALIFSWLLTSCGAAKKICPYNTFHAGCNTLLGEETDSQKTIDQKFNELEENNKELEVVLDNQQTMFQEEIEDIKISLEKQDKDEVELNEKINRLNSIIEQILNDSKGKHKGLNKKEKSNE